MGIAFPVEGSVRLGTDDNQDTLPGLDPGATPERSWRPRNPRTPARLLASPVKTTRWPASRLISSTRNEGGESLNNGRTIHPPWAPSGGRQNIRSRAAKSPLPARSFPPTGALTAIRSAHTATPHSEPRPLPVSTLRHYFDCNVDQDVGVLAPVRRAKRAVCMRRHGAVSKQPQSRTPLVHGCPRSDSRRPRLAGLPGLPSAEHQLEELRARQRSFSPVTSSAFGTILRDSRCLLGVLAIIRMQRGKPRIHSSEKSRSNSYQLFTRELATTISRPIGPTWPIRTGLPPPASNRRSMSRSRSRHPSRGDDAEALWKHPPGDSWVAYDFALNGSDHRVHLSTYPEGFQVVTSTLFTIPYEDWVG